MLVTGHHHPRKLTKLQEFTSILHGLQQNFYQAIGDRCLKTKQNKKNF